MLLATQRMQFRFEPLDAFEQDPNRVDDWVGQIGVFEVRHWDRHKATQRDRMRRNTDDDRARLNRACHDRARADSGIIADVDWPQNRRADAKHDATADRWMSLSPFEARAAERDALIQQHVIADLGRLTDDDAHPVIDDNSPADPGARMYLDAGQPAPGVRYETGEKIQAPAIERVSQPVNPDRVQTRIADDDLGNASGGRVALSDRQDVFAQT